jgi:hypothetical protein
MKSKVDYGMMKLPMFWIGLFSVWTLAQAQQIIVPPYLQPGNASSLTKEQKVVIWQTDSVPGNFQVSYWLTQSGSSAKPSSSKVSFVKLNFYRQPSHLYRASLTGLKFDETYTYQVTLNEKTIAQATFTTRTKKSQTQFAVFADCGAGSPEQAQIAYQVGKQKPQFVLITGDIAYSYGRALEYQKRFFPFYLTSEPSPEKGTNVMSSVPFYMSLGNHDVLSANLNQYQDGLAYFYYNDQPLNAPIPELTIKPEGDPNLIKTFKKNTAPRYPGMSNFSFDHGNVHVTCLDANDYANPLDPLLVEWLTADIKNSRADWKIVSFHQPGFSSAKQHYDDQHTRLLAPICEALGVDLVINSHQHNYQRSVPLKFNPKKDETGTRYIISKEGRVDGQFLLDEKFNGTTNTKPRGIIYIVSGAGGGILYDEELSNKPELWKHEPKENWVPFTAKLVSDIHSFTWIETNGKKMNLKQIDVNGIIIDEITVTK